MTRETTIKGYLFNLIIYAREGERAEYFHNAVRDFISSFPSRVIFITGIGEKNTDFIETECLNEVCDQISIKLTAARASIAPSIILPYLIPDLPTYLLWGSDPTEESELLQLLKRLATRFIYGSACNRDLRSFARRTLKMIKTLKLEYMDLEWAQISGIRDVIARTFNSAEKMAFLKKTREIYIKYAENEDRFPDCCQREAIYLQSWLASRLNWRFTNYDPEGKKVFYHNGNLGLTLYLRAQKRLNLRKGRVFEIEFKTTDRLSIILSLAEKQSKFIYYFSSPLKCDLPLTLPVHDIQRGIDAMKEIFYFRISSHYEGMLEKIAEIPWKN